MLCELCELCLNIKIDKVRKRKRDVKKPTSLTLQDQILAYKNMQSQFKVVKLKHPRLTEKLEMKLNRLTFRDNTEAKNLCLSS